MASFDEEMRMDEEEDKRELEFIREQLPADLKVKFSDSDIYYMMDAIVDYYYTSGILDTDEEEIEIDLQQVAEGVCEQARKDKRGELSADDVFFVVQADMDFQEQNL